MFIHYSFGYITLNGVKIKKGKVKWYENLNLKSYTLRTQLKKHEHLVQ